MEQDESNFANYTQPCLAVYNPDSSPAPVKRSNCYYIYICMST